jgi:pimeloyl-ACP methyl ester carboxylesterase
MSPIQAHTVTGGGGLALHVVETGNPVGRPILFIHGLSFCGLVWSRQLDSELARDFRLVAMDLRGHGRSEKPRDVYGDSKLWADDVHAVIESLHLDRPVLCGWSYGGAVIADYVRRHGEDAIAGTNWTCAISGLGDAFRTSGFIGAEFLTLAPGFFTENVDESVATLDRFVSLCVHRELDPRELYLFLGFTAMVPPHVRRSLFSRQLDNEDVIKSLRKPVLLTYGERDAIVLPSLGRHLAQIAPEARLSLYADTGHSPFWEAPDRFNRELHHFVESIPAARGAAAR